MIVNKESRFNIIRIRFNSIQYLQFVLKQNLLIYDFLFMYSCIHEITFDICNLFLDLKKLLSKELTNIITNKKRNNFLSFYFFLTKSCIFLGRDIRHSQTHSSKN